MTALSSLVVRPAIQQTNPNSPQPFVSFILPDSPILSQPVIPILVAIALPAEISEDYSLSDIFVFAENDFVTTFPLTEEPFFDEKTNSFIWLFFGSYELSLDQSQTQPLNLIPLTLSAYALFEPFEPSSSSLSAYNEFFLLIDLTSFGGEEKQQEKESAKAEKSVSEKSDASSTGGTEGGQISGEARTSQSREVLAREAARRAIAKDPKTARKVFEQEISARALSNAKKNPKSTAKGNGMVITVGAYPDVLPADGKSTAFIVAKVTDEKGNPLPGKIVRFSADGGKLLVPQALTDETGVALSRICSEVLRKGQRKVVTVKAKTNPEAQTQVVMDSNLAQVTSANYSTHISFAWCPNLNAGSEGVICSRGGEEIGGGAQVEFYIKQNIQGEFYPYFWINFIKVLGDGHPRQVGLSHPGRNFGTSGVYCRPSFIPGQEALFTSTVGPGDLTWTRFHHGNVTVVINYTLARYTPPWEPPQMVTGEVSITGTARNAVLKVSENSPPLLAWDPDNPPDESKRTVIFKVESLQSGNITAVVRIYRVGRSNNEGPIKEIWVEGSTNQDIPVVWDGTMDGGEGAEWGEGPNYAEKGLYAYDIQFWLPQFFSDIDEDRRVSPYMVIERAIGENGQQIFEAEYYGYDDKGTEEEDDDEHIYFIRWYVLKCQSAQYDNDGDALIDRDGDGWIKEDWIDGRDDDNDGLVDEDPLGWDEDPPDGIDNDRDGLTDEDGPDPVNASKGEIILYDPDLEPVKTWDLQSLLCLEHNANDGLVASLEGVRHGVLVPVPVSLMQKAGTYYFVLRVWDNHAHLHKDHQVKPALEMNALWRGEKVALVGIKFSSLSPAGQEIHFPIYSRHLPKPIRDNWRPHLCPDSHPEHGHLKPYYPKVTQPPQWKRYLYETGNWKGKLTLCKYPERVAVPMGWKLRVKADIDANLPTPYIVKVKLRCEQMVSAWNKATSSLTFVHPQTGNALSPEVTITNWDAEDYGSLVWESEPLPLEVNQWTIKLKWEIWYYPQGQPNKERCVFETNTHVVYATLGEPLSSGIEDYQNPWYTILDKATEWAAGKTSAADALEAITRKVYDMPLFDYPEIDMDWVLRFRPFSSWDTEDIELDNDKEGIGNDQKGDNDLYPLLPNSNDLSNRYAPTPDAKAQCTDAASILIVLFRAIGIDATTLLIDDPRDLADWFGTKDIDPIGAPSWGRTVWNYHHLGDLRTASPAGPLYDSCLTLDAGGHTRCYVVGMDWSTYKSMLWDGSGTFQIHGRYVPKIVKPYYHNIYRQGSEPF